MSPSDTPRPDTPSPTPPPPTAEESPLPPHGAFLQRLLDPRGLNLLMLAGGGLLVLGVVLWLALAGVFDEPLHAAIGLGAGNLALLGGGVWLASRTRFGAAGRATTMLACLLLPLHLWFYDAQGLVTLDQGGHLWLPALACCAVYAGVARLLKDSLFVYAFAAGVALTGLLFLADGDVARFWEVLAPSTLLVTLGVACIHAERLFPVAADEGRPSAFTRGDFGRAFFRAGHALLASGLGVLLAGRLAGRFYAAWFAHLGWFEQPDVATVTHVKLAALGLALAGVYAYAYSRFAAAAGRRYTVFAVLSLAWSGVIGLDLLRVELTETLIVGLVAALAVVCRLAKAPLAAERQGGVPSEAAATLERIARAATAVALVMVVWQAVRGVCLPIEGWFEFDSWTGHVVSAALVAAAAALELRRPRAAIDAPNRFVPLGLAGVALLVGLLRVASVGGGAAGVALGALLAPVGWCVAGFLQRDRADRVAMLGGAESGAWLVGLLVAPSALLNATVVSAATTLGLAAVFASIAVGAAKQRAGVTALLLAVAAGWQAVVVYHLGVHLPLMLLSVVGLTALVADRLGVAGGFAGVGRLTIGLAATAGGLLACNRLLAGEATWPLLGLLAGQAAVSAVAAAVTPREGGRSGLVAFGVGQLVFAGLVLNSLSSLTFLQRAEVFATAVGVGLVAAGVVGWRRESAASEGEAGAPRDTLTDANLWLGGLLATVPFGVGLVATRLFGGAPTWIALHEIGVLMLGLSLIGAGVLCRLRAPTITGAGVLAVYLLSLVTLVRVPEQLQHVAVYLVAGGGLLFGAAVLLSVYRDRLLAISERAREGEGVFAVLKWR